MSFFKVNDGRGAKSSKTDAGSVLQISAEEVHIVFDDSVEQSVPKTWVSQRTRAWDLSLEIGSVADVHFEVGDDGHRSTSTDIGIVVTNCVEGRVGVQFQDTIQQTVPLGWVARLREWSPGDRVQAHFKTGGGEKSNDTDVATVLAASLLEAELYFDDGIQQCLSKAWITEVTRRWSGDVPELAVGDVVVAHFKRPGNHCRSLQTDRGIILSILPKGQVSIMFQDDVTQVIPKGWIETMATRWSGQREKLAQEEQDGSTVVDASKGRAPAVTGLAARGSTPECVICMDAKPNAVIVHGETCHQCACFTCARRLHRNGDSCPICREPIETVCKHHGE
jgi:hypothetical protein